MSHVYRRNFQEQHSGAALFSLVLLMSLLLQALSMAPVQAARHSAPPPPSLTGTGPNDPRELETFLDGVISKQLQVDHIPGPTKCAMR